MHTLKLTAALAAALALAACSTSPEKGASVDADAGTKANVGGPTTSAISDSTLDENALYAGKPAPANSTVYFDYDSFTIGEKYRVMLREHAAFLAANLKRHVTIEAHADERGSAEYNIALSEKRGNAIRDMLVLQGAGPGQISVVAYGEEKPVCEEHNESCWALNRRGELVYGSR